MLHYCVIHGNTHRSTHDKNRDVLNTPANPELLRNETRNVKCFAVSTRRNPYFVIRGDRESRFFVPFIHHDGLGRYFTHTTLPRSSRCRTWNVGINDESRIQLAHRTIFLRFFTPMVTFDLTIHRHLNRTERAFFLFLDKPLSKHGISYILFAVFVC